MNIVAPNRSLPLSAPVETALATVETVSKETLLTVPTFQQQLDAGMTDAAAMTVHELAPIVIAGCEKMSQYIPYIHSFLLKCEDLPRDSKNRWVTPVEGCFSVKEFFVNKCRRAPQTIYEHIRKFEAAEKHLLPGGATPTPKEKKLKKKTAIVVAQEGVPAAAVAAEVEKVKAKVFEAGRLAERAAQAILAAKNEPENPNAQDGDLQAAISAADEFSLELCTSFTSGGKVNDAKLAKQARKHAVLYRKMRGLRFVDVPHTATKGKAADKMTFDGTMPVTGLNGELVIVKAV